MSARSKALSSIDHFNNICKNIKPNWWFDDGIDWTCVSSTLSHTCHNKPLVQLLDQMFDSTLICNKFLDPITLMANPYNK